MLISCEKATVNLSHNLYYANDYYTVDYKYLALQIYK